MRTETGAALLVIEHDLPLLTAVSDRLLALDLGMVLVEGPPDEVVADPRVVSSYLGTPDGAAVARSGARRVREEVSA
jgi:branched-chain amino acid transport system ATP-binding protein